MIRALIVTLGIFHGLPAAWPAENDGRWWWQSSIRLGQQNNRNSASNAPTIGYNHQDLRLSWGLTGYVVHPELARFRIDTDLLLSKTDGARGTDSGRVGLGAELEALPRGAYPFRLHYRRELLDYSGLGGASVFARGTPDVRTTWGGSFWSYRGPLKGTGAGFNRRGIDFLEPGTQREVSDHHYVRWHHGGNSNRHRVRLDRRSHEFGFGDYSTDDVTLSVEDDVRMTPNWRWRVDGNAIRRDFTISASAQTIRDYLLTNVFRGDVRNRDRVNILVSSGLTEPGGSPKVGAQSASIEYTWQPNRVWSLATIARHDRQSSADRSVRSPSAGLAAIWFGRGRGFDSQISATATFGRIREDTASGTRKDKRLDYGATASFSHGHPGALRKTLSLEWFSREFRVRRRAVVGFPDLGLSQPGIGVNETYRARLELARAYDSRSLRAWGEWSGQSGRQAFGSGRELKGYHAGAALTARRLNVQGNAGQTTLTQPGASTGQELRFASITASWRALRYLALNGAYRMDQRRFDTLQGTDGTILEAGMTFRLGEFSLNTSLYQRTSDLVADGERTNRILRVTLTSRFAGWLPIVSGTKRRGVIR